MSSSEVNATPAAVDLAAANEVDLEDIEGTGDGGRVTVADVRDHVEEQGDTVVETQTLNPEDEPGAEQQPSGEEELKPITKNGAEPSETAPVPEFSVDDDRGDIAETEFEGELPALILEGYWVKLASHPDIPEEHWGAIANVVESPWSNAPWQHDTEDTITGYEFDEDKDFLVKTRGSGEALISVPAEAIAESAEDRPTLLAYA